MRIRVVHVNKLYYPWVGGVEKVVQNLAEGLRHQFDVEVLVCQPKGHGSVEWVNGVRVTRAGSLGTVLSMPVSPSFPILFRRLADEVDIVHVHLPFPLATLSWWRKRAGQGLVVSYHSDIVRQRWLKPVYGPSMRRMLADADAIVVSSPNLVESSAWIRVHRDKCRVIPFFIDGSKKAAVSKRAMELRQQLQIPDDRPVVLFVGRLVYYKGVEYLIRAMQAVDAVLLLVGTGPLEHDLKRLVSDLGIERKVRFLGKVSDATLDKCYQLCSFLVLPSVEPTETFGLVQLEAMAYGKPVINTELPTGVPFVSLHGETGLTVPPRDVTALANAIALLCENDQLRLRLGQAAKLRAETVFDRKKVLASVAGLYREVVRKKK